MVLGDVDAVKSGSPVVGRRLSFQETVDIEAGFKTKSATPRKAVADPERQEIGDVPETGDLDPWGMMVSPMSCATSCWCAERECGVAYCQGCKKICSSKTTARGEHTLG